MKQMGTVTVRERIRMAVQILRDPEVLDRILRDRWGEKERLLRKSIVELQTKVGDLDIRLGELQGRYEGQARENRENGETIRRLEREAREKATHSTEAELALASLRVLKQLMWSGSVSRPQDREKFSEAKAIYDALMGVQQVRGIL